MLSEKACHHFACVRGQVVASISPVPSESWPFPWRQGRVGVCLQLSFCVQLQDVGGSSSTSNNIEFSRGKDINEDVWMPSNHGASSPKFGPYVSQSRHAPPPEAPAFEDLFGTRMMQSPNIDDQQGGGGGDKQ
ncbi:hypothetical protein PIB30_014662 [Stylosanthes scabra]|uniref:Uncharacterized protein n=1 Tax=Stylosanthes scabra TaxID=79078 RepID=A0ABU6T6G9_9FABA|nr:hypothetical protein [Stylosanthes scabra]